MKILFNGFRHSHIYGLYQKVADCPSLEIVGCIEPDAKAREDALKNLDIAFSEVDYDTWLASDVDIVAIGNAYGDRGENIIKALRAGKHVIADKPICTSLEQLATIRQLLEQTGLQLGCMLDLRFLPQVLKAKEIISSGRLGQVRNVSFNGQHGLGYGSRPMWYFEKGMHGGTLNDLAIHGVDLVRYISGQEFAAVNAARTWNAFAEKEPDFGDCATFMAQLDNGASVLADVSYSTPAGVGAMPTYWEFRFWCDKGMLTFCYFDKDVTLYEAGVKGAQRIETDPATEDYLTEFLAQIQTGERTMTENVLVSSEAVLKIQKAADEG